MKPLGFQPARGNKIQADVLNVQNMPRAKVYSTAGAVGFGPGGANFTWTAAEYDTDGMTFQPGLTDRIVCHTAGLYIACAQIVFTGGAGLTATQVRIAANSGLFIAQNTDYRDPGLFAAEFSPVGLWRANAGDNIALRVDTSAACNISGGIDYLYLAACMISTNP